MAAEPMDIRMARLEGAYEQITARLAGVEREVSALRSDVAGQFAEQRRRMDTQFYWLLTLVLGSILVPVLRDLAR
jgi:hypothetical protein